MATWQSRTLRLLSLLICFLIAAGSAVAEALKDIPAPTNYVNDYAGVLNQSTIADLNALCRSLDTQTHTKLFVATIHKVDGDVPIQDFSLDLATQWKIGTKGGKEGDRGLLLLLSVDDHKRWIQVGYGLEGILNDAKVGDIGRDMVPDLQAGNYDGAVRTGVNDLANGIAQDAGVTLATAQHTYHRESARSTGGGSSRIISLFVLLFFVWMIFRGGGRGGRGGGGGFLTGMLLGNLLGGSGGGFGGGGFGGGGGRDDNDSGGGFSPGDGGGFGGGGAGGSW